MTTSATSDQPRTVLGPLTTTFTPPDSCGYVAVPTSSWGGSRGYQGQSCKSNSAFGLVDATECWPHTTAGAPYPSVPFGRWGLYSPGLLCPSGYTGACTATASGDADWAVQFAMSEGETAVGCCPTGLTCFFNAEASGGSCGHTTTSTVVTFATCNSEDTLVEDPVYTYPRFIAATTTGDAATSTLSGTLATQSTTTLSSVTIWAPMIQIYWHSTDLEAASTSETTYSTTSQSASAENNSSSDDISTGAAVGIGVGCGIAAISIAAISAFLIRRRRQRNKAEGANKASSKGADQAAKYQHLQQEQQHQHQPSIPELDGHTGPSELPGTRIVAEM